jgi:cytochrome c-type biogenesis protein CcmH
MTYTLKACTFIATLLIALAALAAEPLVFDSPEQEDRFNSLTEELRCTVCQNQNLADSDAQLAKDLRNEIYKMLMAGQTDQQIKEFMVQRYGDFVLYRPPVQGNTMALWVMPVVLLLIGSIAVFFTVRNRNRKLAEQKLQANKNQKESS